MTIASNLVLVCLAITGSLLVASALHTFIPPLVRRSLSFGIGSAMLRSQSIYANSCTPASSLNPAIGRAIREIRDTACADLAAVVVFRDGSEPQMWSVASSDCSCEASILPHDCIVQFREVLAGKKARISKIGEDDNPLSFAGHSFASGDSLAICPIVAFDHGIGVLVLGYTRSRAINQRDLSILQQHLSGLALMLANSRLAESASKMAILSDSKTALLRLAASGCDIVSMMSDAMQLLKDFVRFDMISVAVVEPDSTTLKRYSVTDAGTRVVERGLSMPISDTLVGHVAEESAPQICNHINGIDFKDDAWLARCGFSSRLAVPVKIEDTVVAVLSFASIESDGYCREDVTAAAMLADVFAVVVKLTQLRERDRRLLRQLNGLVDVFDNARPSAGFEDRALNVCKMLTRELPVSAARLFAVSDLGRPITPVAQECRRAMWESIDVTPVGYDSGRTKWHRDLLEAGRLRLFRQDDPEMAMPAEELTMMYPENPRSGAAMPTTLPDGRRGFLTVTEVRDWSRQKLDCDALAIIEVAGLLLSLGIVNDGSICPTLSSRLGRSIQDAVDDNLLTFINRKMVGPVSAILGAAEVLRKGFDDDESKSRVYVDMIRRNADLVAKAMHQIRELGNCDGNRCDRNRRDYRLGADLELSDRIHTDLVKRGG